MAWSSSNVDRCLAPVDLAAAVTVKLKRTSVPVAGESSDVLLFGCASTHLFLLSHATSLQLLFRDVWGQVY